MCAGRHWGCPARPLPGPYLFPACSLPIPTIRLCHVLPRGREPSQGVHQDVLVRRVPTAGGWYLSPSLTHPHVLPFPIPVLPAPSCLDPAWEDPAGCSRMGAVCVWSGAGQVSGSGGTPRLQHGTLWLDFMDEGGIQGWGGSPPPPAPTPLWHLHSSHQECSSGLTCFPGGWKRGCDSSAGHGTQHLGIPKMGDTIWDPPSHPG